MRHDVRSRTQTEVHYDFIVILSQNRLHSLHSGFLIHYEAKTAVATSKLALVSLNNNRVGTTYPTSTRELQGVRIGTFVSPINH